MRGVKDVAPRGGAWLRCACLCPHSHLRPLGWPLCFGSGALGPPLTPLGAGPWARSALGLLESAAGGMEDALILSSDPPSGLSERGAERQLHPWMARFALQS